VTSPRNLLLRTFVGYTHPLLPWLAFLCAGVVIGRLLPLTGARRAAVLACGLVLFAASYAIAFVGTRVTDDRLVEKLISTNPWDRGVLFTANALGSAIVALVAISWLADRWTRHAVVAMLAGSGRMTLTLYVAHVLVFNALTNWWGWVRPTGLDTALVFAAGFWVIAVAAGAWWDRFVGIGPLERVYRGFGG
jgi:uncharacterized membrane protein YeiB